MVKIASLVLALLAMQSSSSTPEFEVASIKLNTMGDGTATTNVPLGPGNVFTPTGGYLSVVNMPLWALIGFAYKITGDQEQYLRPRLADWVLTERYNVEARAAGNPAKDEMRLMVRSLLAERCKLAVHYETRQAPVVAMVLAKAGKTGPRFRPHPAGPACSTVPDWENPRSTPVSRCSAADCCPCRTALAASSSSERAM